MESVQTLDTAVRNVYMISGEVEITTGKKRERRKFSMGICAGNTDEDRRKNFRFYRTIYLDKKERMRMKDIEDEGRVKLLNYEIVKPLGFNHVNVHN